ncbi:ShlB/FhaC/HecB family hemolysin secretion/activation protein [Bordetella avium]|uniref:ShlB/FhaC/HecB family hemolysin secretion/activation protein n=1 Tax=Bordetella avium TaxID=521 RepID=UPI000E13EDB3|nr:ShlB/FhaC/HecB family hemolysin secretion/activation protein [Bordetella avium]WQE35104.1 ShlB/FhaC/HecB family hemolysin secretion/activation protein [Bordetella avium]SUV68774.1 hemolysin activator protein [Bordetella avium]
MTKPFYAMSRRALQCAFLCLLPWLAYAQPRAASAVVPPPELSGQQPLTPGQRDLNIQQNRMERELQQQRIDRALNQQPGTDLRLPAPPQAPHLKEEGHTVSLSGVDLDFGPVAPLFDVDTLVKSYLNRPLNNRGVFEVVRSLSAKLYEQGYVTSNIALDNPAVVDGRLKLRVNWGRIKGWRINGKPLEGWRESAMVGWAMPNWRNAILNIRDMDQAIENLNNGFKQVTVTVAPAEDYGYSYLDLTVVRNDWLRFSLGRDNSGQDSSGLGRDKYNLSVSAGDLLGINDTLTMLTSQRHYSDAANYGEKSYDMAWRVPLGYTRFDVQAGFSNYKSLLKGPGYSYPSTGNSRKLSVRLTRTLYRDATSQFSVYGVLKTQQNKNYLANTLLAVNSKHYSDGTLGIQWSKQQGRYALFADLSWNRGLGINNGQYAAFNQYEAIGNVSRVNGTASWQANFAPADRIISVQSQFGFQQSRQMLLNSYQLTLGDEYTVRGFNRSTLQSGDKGMYLTNTVSMPFTQPWWGGVRLAPFLGLDGGLLKQNSPGARSVRMASWATGLRINTSHWSMSATYSKALVTQAGLSKKPVWYINTSIFF